MREGGVTHPQFVTGKKGRPYCAALTDFDGRRLDEYDNERLERPLRPHSLACNRCEHYCKDECYFSAASIDSITKDIFKRRVRCDICIYWFVASPMVSLQKIYFEKSAGGTGYAICPWCDHYLKTGNHVQKRKRAMSILLIVLAVSVVTTLWLMSSLRMTYCLLLWGDISAIETILVEGILMIWLWSRWIKRFKMWRQKRRNLKNYLFDVDRGQKTKLFLAVD